MPVRDNQENHRFEADANGAVAVLEYRLEGSRLVLTHAEVPPESRGQGIGDELAVFALDSARKRNLRVVPACKFMRKFIDEHEEYQDLVAE